MFVDDMKIYLHCNPECLPDAIKIISEDTSSFYNYVTRNKLKLNLFKTIAMIFGIHYHISRIDLSTCSSIINGQPIPNVTTTKTLGVWLDQEFSWSRQVSKIVSKVNSLLFCLRMFKHLLSFNVRKHLVESLIFLQFHYACVTLLNFSLDLNNKLKRSLNSETRIVFKIPHFFHISFYRDQLS